jgi:hypothetical protein
LSEVAAEEPLKIRHHYQDKEVELKILLQRHSVLLIPGQVNYSHKEISLPPQEEEEEEMVVVLIKQHHQMK